VDIVSPLIAHPQAALPVLPRVRSLDDPAMAPQSLLRFDAGTSNARSDAASVQSSTVLPRGVRLVGMQLGRSVARTTPRLVHLGDGVQQGEQLMGVMDVSSRQTLGQWQALSVDEKMMLATCLRSVRRVLAREGPPFEARTLEESIEARLKSTWPRCPSSLSSTHCSCSNTPARVHCSRRRQAVIPDRPNCFVGSISQGIPVRSTKTMASKAARSSARGRPGFFFLGTGSSGATRSHSASGTRSRAIGPKCSWPAHPSTLPSALKPYFC
jgi:hypothetical protein